MDQSTRGIHTVASSGEYADDGETTRSSSLEISVDANQVQLLASDSAPLIKVVQHKKQQVPPLRQRLPRSLVIALVIAALLTGITHWLLEEGGIWLCGHEMNRLQVDPTVAARYNLSSGDMEGTMNERRGYVTAENVASAPVSAAVASQTSISESPATRFINATLSMTTQRQQQLQETLDVPHAESLTLTSSWTTFTLVECTLASVPFPHIAHSWWFLANHVTDWQIFDTMEGVAYLKGERRVLRQSYRYASTIDQFLMRIGGNSVHSIGFQCQWPALELLSESVTPRTEHVMTPLVSGRADLQQFLPGVHNDFNDDAGWWMLALLEVYKSRKQVLTEELKQGSTSQLLTTVQHGWQLLLNQWDKSDLCVPGGIFWRSDRHAVDGTYKATIANALMFAITARTLRVAEPELLDASHNMLYRQVGWALYEWLMRMESEEHPGTFYDGWLIEADGTCTQRNWLFTYNSGVILGALVDWAEFTLNDMASEPVASQLLADIVRITRGSLDYFTDSQLLLSGERTSPTHDDAIVFKAVYVRNLADVDAFLLRVLTRAAWPPINATLQATVVDTRRYISQVLVANWQALNRARREGSCVWSCDWASDVPIKDDEAAASCQLAATSLAVAVLRVVE